MLIVAGALVGAYLLLVFVGSNDLAFRLQRAMTGGDEYASEELALYNQLSRLGDLHRTDAAMPVVALVGGSTARESLLSEVALEDRIRELGGPDVRAFDLTSSGQDLILSWALSEVAACSGADFVVIGLNQNRIRNLGTNHPLSVTGYWGQDVRRFVEAGDLQPRFAKPAEALVSEARARSLLFVAVVDAALSGRETATEADLRHAGTHRYSGRPADPGRPVTMLTNIERSLADRPQPPPDYLRRIKDSVERCGGRMIVVFNAINPIGLDASTYPLLAQAQFDLRALVAEADVGSDHVVDLQLPAIGLEPADFYDWGHLHLPDAMARTTDALGSALLPLLMEREQ